MLPHLFRSLSDRLKALFAADVALDFEAHFLSRQAERRAALLQQADRHERDGAPAVAARLRADAEALDAERPLAGVPAAPVLEDVVGDPAGAALAAPDPKADAASTNGASSADGDGRRNGSRRATPPAAGRKRTEAATA